MSHARSRRAAFANALHAGTLSSQEIASASTAAKRFKKTTHLFKKGSYKMKKSLILIVIFIIACAVSSCTMIGSLVNGAVSEALNDHSGSQSENAVSIDLGELPEVSEGILLSGMDSAEKQAFKEEAAKQGIDVEFGSDGSTTMKYPDGSIVIQKPDGSYSFKTDEGVGEYGNNWPDNSYTKMIPKPDFAVSMTAADEDEFTVLFSTVTEDQLKAYTEAVKEAGFDKNQQTEDTVLFGTLVYSYTAENDSGYQINIYSTAGICGLSITKID
jgi:hypothetical protein